MDLPQAIEMKYDPMKPYRRGPPHRLRSHHRVITPDGGVIMCSTEEDADRVVREMNDAIGEIDRLRAGEPAPPASTKPARKSS